MFVFYSNRAGCLKSILISIALSAALLLILAFLNGLL